MVTTAWFIELVNKWFFHMTARCQSGGLSLSNIGEYQKTLDVLQEFIYIYSLTSKLEREKFLNLFKKESSYPPLQ